LDSFDDQEDQASNIYRGCQIGACFSCGLGVGTPVNNGQRDGNTNISGWQNGRPNPLPEFAMPDEFYTPILLPGMYLPFQYVSREIDDGSPFRTIDEPELARYVAAFLDHETVHCQLLVGVVPMLMRLIDSRCYALLALLTKNGFDPSLWESLLSQSKNIEKIFKAIAPLHEVVANVSNFVESKDNRFVVDNVEQSLAYYNKRYGKSFTRIFSDFSFIISSLEDWFAPNPIQSFTIYTLAEFMLMGAIDSTEIRADLFTSPPLVPKEDLSYHLNHHGLPYFATDKQPPSPARFNVFPYSVFTIEGRLQEIKSGIQNAKRKRRKKSLKTSIEQLLYIANAVPGYFHEWLQCIDILTWLKRRVLNGISDMQEMIKGLGFELPLIEAWQSNMAPFISIIIPRSPHGGLVKSTDEFEFINYGIQREHFFEKMYAQLDEHHSQLIKDHISSEILIAYSLQSDRTLGVWYAPACGEPNRAPITPTVKIIGENCDAAQSLGNGMFELAIFESLRVQVASGKGISCLLRHQHGGRCCGRAALMWSIYEAGMKARDINELNWKPTNWIKPECSKTDNE
jgi:hypothetical protein